jgi:NAD+ synthase (glutamine-hydrolysing)
MRILIAQINPIVGDLKGNTEKIIRAIENGNKGAADLVLFPEMALSGYPPEDLLLLPHFIKSVEHYLQKIVEATKGMIAVVGTPRFNESQKGKHLFNSAAIIQNRQLLGFQDKTLLPTYDVFDERRYFEPACQSKVWNLSGKKVAMTICEDIWGHSDLLEATNYHQDPIAELKSYQPDILLNLSASPFSLGKIKNRFKVCARSAESLSCPLVYCNQVGGNDGLVFDGYSFLMSEKGQILQIAKGFEEDLLFLDLAQKRQPIEFVNHPTEDLYRALVLGIRDYFFKQGFSKACLGLSGGIDSAVVACLAAEALGKNNVLGIAMPSRFSSESSLKDAYELAKALDIQFKTIPIESVFEIYLELLSHEFHGKPFDVTEENIQARIRGMILMAISNKEGYLVLSTGNKSELAMGYSTLYGDMVGGLGVINDVTKKQVYELAEWVNQDEEIIPQNSITKAPSAELRPNQKDSDSLPDYSIIDHVLKAYVEDHQSPEEIAKKFNYSLDIVCGLIERLHRNEYKRRQGAPGIRVSEKAFSAGRRFPIVQRWI